MFGHTLVDMGRIRGSSVGLEDHERHRIGGGRMGSHGGAELVCRMNHFPRRLSRELMFGFYEVSVGRSVLPCCCLVSCKVSICVFSSKHRYRLTVVVEVVMKDLRHSSFCLS